MELLLFLCLISQSLAASHILQYFTAVTPRFSFTFGELDGEQFVYFNSSMSEVIPKAEWIKNVDADEPDYRKSERARFSREHNDLRHHVNQTMEAKYHPKGDYTLQIMYGCELDDDGTTRGYYQFGYDGEDLITLDLKTGTWTAANDKAENFIQQWDPEGYYAEEWKNYLEKKCIEWLKQYIYYRRETPERRVHPEVSVFQKHSSSPEVVCLATGFFPKAVNITWQKDGEDVHEDVELRETLPNQDGSFQKRSILKVPAEELQKHTYTCVIQHSSLEKELVLPVSERRILSEHRGGGSDGGSEGVLIGLIVFVALFGLITLVVIMIRINGTLTDPKKIIKPLGVIVVVLLLIVVLAGILLWKRKSCT